MSHQGNKCCLIGILGCFPEGGEHIHRLTFFVLHQWILRWITFDIAGCIGGISILPAGKPDQDHLEAILTSVAYHVIYRCKIILAWFTFYNIPRAGSNDSVEVSIFHLLPHTYLLHIAFAGASGVVQLTSKHDKGFPVNLKVGNSVLLYQCRLCLRSQEEQRGSE